MNIKINGNYSLMEQVPHKASDVILFVSGTLGAATVTVTYLDEAGLYIPLIDGSLTAGSQYEIRRAFGADYYATVAGADGSTDINLLAVGGL